MIQFLPQNFYLYDLVFFCFTDYTQVSQTYQFSFFWGKTKITMFLIYLLVMLKINLVYVSFVTLFIMIHDSSNVNLSFFLSKVPWETFLRLLTHINCWHISTWDMKILCLGQNLSCTCCWLLCINLWHEMLCLWWSLWLVEYHHQSVILTYFYLRQVCLLC